MLKKMAHWPWGWIAFVLAAIGLWAAARPLGAWLQAVNAWIQGMGGAGMVLFIGLYILVTLVLLPASVLTIGAGAAYGLAWGVVLVSLASTSGACLAFLIARYLARDPIRKRAEGNRKFQALDSAMEEDGWKIVGLLRLSPLVPFGLQNYFFGVTRVGFLPYLLASWSGMLPGTFLYVYLGYVGKAGANALSAKGGEAADTLEYVFLGIGLVATLAVTLYATRLAKRRLDRTGAVP